MRGDYNTVWQDCTVEFNEGESGGEVYPEELRNILGPLMYRLSVYDTEKVIIHEFLHVALDKDYQSGRPFSGPAQHPQINRILIRILNYREPCNPADLDQKA